MKLRSTPLRTLMLALPVAAALLSACAGNGSSIKPVAVAEVKPTRGNTANGQVSFAPGADGVAVRVRLHGVQPGEHGFHVHEKGDCSAPDATSAGGHWNPDAQPHGPQSGMHHAGDMPSLKADASGEVDTSFTLPGTASGYVGHAVVVHADADDFKTQPTGNSGARVACGVIVDAKP